jgi:hypothetical protein
LNGGNRGPEGDHFGCAVLGLAIRYRLQIGQWIKQREGADSHSRGSLNPLDKCAPLSLPTQQPRFAGFQLGQIQDKCAPLSLPTQQPGDAPDGGGIMDGFYQLGRNRGKKCRFLLIELARRPSLSHQYAQRPALIDQRHAEESVIAFFLWCGAKTITRDEVPHPSD